MFEGETLLITGGTGSFGRTAVGRLLQEDVKELRILSRDERKQQELRRRHPDGRLRFFLGDVRDRDSMWPAVRGAQRVFHAAALKQVPACEENPMEAYKTNVAGTQNLLELAEFCGVERVVCLSTDKAVYPVNAMGCTKAMMEKLVLAKAMRRPNKRTAYCLTRFGNVLCSRGSVVPLFIGQMLAGRPLTVTNPDMTRFLMTLPEAVELALYALQNGENGGILVPRMRSCTVAVLAQAVQKLFGSKGELTVTGPRDGEKLHETLIALEEMPRTVDRDSYLCISQSRKPDTACTRPAYTSDAGTLLHASEVARILREVDFVKEALSRWDKMGR